MKRLIAILIVLVAAATVLVLGTGAGNGGGRGSYRVRAIFDNAVSVIPGEDVKVAGVKVGKVESLDVTKEQKAAIVLRIVSPGFDNFRSDAECTIRPQSLIGEKYVECTPTQPRAPGAPEAPPLPKVKHGPGKGQHLVPVTQTHTPVDIDLINNILRRPYAERLTLILAELGTTVAGRGQDLNQLIRRADPALAQTDRVLKIVADQNRDLANLARDSDTVLAPLARDRARVADSIVQTNTVAQATAERGDALEGNFRRLPPFLRRLQVTAGKLSNLSDQATPVFADLGAQARNINAFVLQLAPFSRAAIPAIRSLGVATVSGTPAVKALLPTTKLLQTFAARTRPVAANLAKLTTSLKNTKGIERILDYIFYQVAAINGFDAFGHYLRAALIVNTCSNYSTEPVGGCSANFTDASASSASNGAGSDPISQRTAAALRGQAPPTAQPTRSPSEGTGGSAQGAVSPTITLPGQGTGAATARVRRPAPSSDPKAGLFNYLLGNDGQ